MSNCAIVFSSPCDDDGDRWFSKLFSNYKKLGRNYWISCEAGCLPAGQEFDDKDKYMFALLYEKEFKDFDNKFKKIDVNIYEQDLIKWFENHQEFHSTVDVVVIFQHGNTAADSPEFIKIQHDICERYFKNKQRVYLTYSHGTGDDWYNQMGCLIKALEKDETLGINAHNFFIRHAITELFPAFIHAVYLASHNPNNSLLIEAALKRGDSVGLLLEEPVPTIYSKWREVAISQTDSKTSQLLHLASQIKSVFEEIAAPKKKP